MSGDTVEQEGPLTADELDAIAVEAFGFSETFLDYQANYALSWCPRHALNSGAVSVAQAAARIARAHSKTPDVTHGGTT